jgi:RNA polymerase sigma-70 factor, ECF subfamily
MLTVARIQVGPPPVIPSVMTLAETVTPPFGLAARTSDADLIVRIAGGDRAAFEELYQRFARPVLSLALRLLGDHGRAEDAAQDTFAAVWRSARSFHPERGSGSAWLFAVARHAIIDRARQRVEPAVETVGEEASSEPGPAETAEQAWLAWQVHSALDRLPERERVVLELAYYSGLSQREVASYLNVPLGTVKTRTRAGLSRLAPLLEATLE